jgi:hypothetical protein
MSELNIFLYKYGLNLFAIISLFLIGLVHYKMKQEENKQRRLNENLGRINRRLSSRHTH